MSDTTHVGDVMPPIAEGCVNHPTLLAALKAAARPLTAEEVREQRASWVYGSMSWGSMLSKDEIRTMLDKP